MTPPTNAQVVTAWAASLTTWDDDRIETEFTDPADGLLYVFTITRSAARPACTDDRDRLMIRARGEVMRDLAKAHAAEFEARLALKLAELGVGTPELARRA